jgi:predicted RNA-binding protein
MVVEGRKKVRVEKGGVCVEKREVTMVACWSDKRRIKYRMDISTHSEHRKYLHVQTDPAPPA